MIRSVIAFFRTTFTTDDEGNAVTEYAVCLALIVLGCILAVNALGVTISELFPDLAELIS